MSRSKKARPGQLRIFYGKLPRERPDICVAWGENTDKSDGRFLLGTFTNRRYRYDFGAHKIVWDHSTLDELTERGYDIKTLKVSIERLPSPAPGGPPD